MVVRLSRHLREREDEGDMIDVETGVGGDRLDSFLFIVYSK